MRSERYLKAAVRIFMHVVHESFQYVLHPVSVQSITAVLNVHFKGILAALKLKTRWISVYLLQSLTISSMLEIFLIYKTCCYCVTAAAQEKHFVHFCRLLNVTETA